MTTQQSLPSNCTVMLGAGVIVDASTMTSPCFTATSKSNIRICGDGKIVCAAGSVPSFTSVTGLTVDVRIEDSSGVQMFSVVSALNISPSGDSTGASDTAAFTRAIAAASAAVNGVVNVAVGDYTVQSAIVGASNVHIVFAPGVRISLCDKLTKACSYTTGTTVSAINTTGLRAGMLVSDPAANLSANDPFGDIPYDTTIATVGATSITLSDAPTGSGSSLVFHPTEFIFNWTDCDNWSMTCPGGWAYLDGNWQHAYPYATTDGRGDSCIRVVTCSDYIIDGIQCDNAFYHGLLGVGEITNGRHPRYRATGNGYRGLHYHAEAVVGNTTPEVRQNWFGRVEIEDGGHRAFYTIASNLNSGLFVALDNVIGTQIDSVYLKNERGNGLAIAGAFPASAFDPNFVSKHLQFGNVTAEGCRNGLFINAQAEHVQGGNFTAFGKVVRIAACATLAAASVDRYYVNETGTPGSIKVKAIQCPAGSIAANGIREGVRVAASNSATGIPADGVMVWEVEIGAGAGGTDLVWVFDDDNTAGDPYTTADASETISFFWSADSGVYLFDASGDQTKHLKFGNVSTENCARYGVRCAYSSSQFRCHDLSIDSLTIVGSRIAAELASINFLKIGKLHHKNSGSLLNTGTVSGSADLFLYNVCNFEIGLTTYEHTAAHTTNNERIRFDADCRNGHAGPFALSLPASGDTINALVTSGAAANAAGVSGPIKLIDPRGADGTLLTVTGGYITRTNADACIVWRPADAGDAG
jgi:hypothetical protein